MNFEILADASPAIIIHTIFAFAALFIGIAMWARKKGTRSHKYLGRVFAVFMAMTALTAIFIRQINNGGFSFIHLFVPLTFFALWQTFYYVRKGNIRRHKSAVKGLFFGALLIPGILSFFPGRVLWHVVTGS